MLCALNRPQEFKQAAIHCGVPAGVDAFRNATNMFAELDKK